MLFGLVQRSTIFKKFRPFGKQPRIFIVLFKIFGQQLQASSEVIFTKILNGSTNNSLTSHLYENGSVGLLRKVCFSNMKGIKFGKFLAVIDSTNYEKLIK